jgi:2,5-diamino-6-(ribosylamino)-4(3H)-pyrimidinone 5'-phosphate reductase
MPDPSCPWLVVVDSRGRVNCWSWLKQTPFWRIGIALCSEATPAAHLAGLEQQGIERLIISDQQVDLSAALQLLSERYGIRLIRVDSGGVLNGALLRAGLVDEVSLLIDPYLVGGTTPHGVFTAPDLTGPEGIIRLRLLSVDQPRQGTVWLRYEVCQYKLDQDLSI